MWIVLVSNSLSFKTRVSGLIRVVLPTQPICQRKEPYASYVRERERMVRGPRHQRKEKPGKRGPKSWREKAKLPRKAGLDKRNQFRLNKKKSKAAMKRYRTFFRYMWRSETSGRYCARLGMRKPNKGFSLRGKWELPDCHF